MPASRARALAPIGFLIGRSVHSVDEAVRVARRRRPGLSAVWRRLCHSVQTGSARPPACSILAEVAAATPLPVLAVGGITADTVPQLAGSGSAGFAAIGWFADGGEGVAARAGRRCTRVREGMTDGKRVRNAAARVLQARRSGGGRQDAGRAGRARTPRARAAGTAGVARAETPIPRSRAPRRRRCRPFRARPIAAFLARSDAPTRAARPSSPLAASSRRPPRSDSDGAADRHLAEDRRGRRRQGR